LAEREKTLFNLDDTLRVYDLTSTYFEGEAGENAQAHLGYARDKRFDCKQVLVGLVLDLDGFPKAHGVFEGYRQDRQALKQMLESLEKRVGRKPGFTVVVDRGMVPLCGKQNMADIRAYGVRRDFNRQMNQILYDIRLVGTSDFGFWQEL
jgi:transposase